jgi:hypothetical protein
MYDGRCMMEDGRWKMYDGRWWSGGEILRKIGWTENGRKAKWGSV